MKLLSLLVIYKKKRKKKGKLQKLPMKYDGSFNYNLKLLNLKIKLSNLYDC